MEQLYVCMRASRGSRRGEKVWITLCMFCVSISDGLPLYNFFGGRTKRMLHINRIQLSGVIIIEENKLLLMWKRKHNHYELPGGKVEVGETPEQTAIRETKEEIACDVKIIKYLGYKDFHITGKDFRSHKYLAQIPNGQIPKIMEPELFRDIFWMPLKEYQKYSLAPNVRSFCEEYIEKE